MGFYDSYDFEGLKFFSKLKTSSLNNPCKEFLSIIKQLKLNTPPQFIYPSYGFLGFSQR